MQCNNMRLCVVVTVSVVLAALFLIGIFLLVPFPLAVQPAIIRGQLYLHEHGDGSYPKSTHYWAHYPATQYYDFYFFNVTNPDEVVNYGAKAHIVEIGPYSYAEREFKEHVTFFDGGNQVYYFNNKTWYFSPENSCNACKYDDVMTLPNAAYMAFMYVSKTERFPPVLNYLGDILLLLLGEYPTRTVPMAGVLFEGYDDPLLDLANSQLGQLVLNYTHLDIPHIPAMGYLVGYNHSRDGDYISRTGKDKIENIDLIQQWCNRTHLPWWGDDYSQDISQSGDGSYQKPYLKKTDTLKQFQSFICRAFYAHYDSETSVQGIPAYKFKMDNDTYDTTIAKNKGYRYENKEMVDYFPSWPCGTDHVYKPDGDCENVDCTVAPNLCNSCCDGSHIHGPNATVLLPPGVIPLRCFPGQLQALPIGAFLSPPHFAWSPPEVYNNVNGLNPDPMGKHEPGVFDISHLTGSSMNANFRLQVTVPFYNDNIMTMLQNTGNNFIPTVWIDLRIVMDDEARNFLYLTTNVLEKLVLGFGIGFTALSIVGGGLFLFCIFRERKVKADRARKYEEVMEQEGQAWS